MKEEYLVGFLAHFLFGLSVDLLQVVKAGLNGGVKASEFIFDSAWRNDSSCDQASFIGHAVTSLGCAEGLFDKTVAYVNDRKLYGQPMHRLQPVAYWLGKARANIEAARTLCYAAARASDDGKPEPTGIPIGETIRNIGRSGSWAALKNIERSPQYAALLADLLAELKPSIEARTGRMLHTQAFVFITSPGGLTPYHFDPEHNILLQIRGSKVLTQFPAGDSTYAPDETHEAYHTGGPRELKWRDELQDGGKEFAIGPGEALFVPVMAPHYVRNGDEPSISLSITWRSEWSFAEADARAFNKLLPRAGLHPSCPGRWPERNRAKSIAGRSLRRLCVVR